MLTRNRATGRGADPMGKRDRLLWRIEMAKKAVADLEEGYERVRQTGRILEARQALSLLERSREALGAHERALDEHDATDGEPRRNRTQ